MNIVITDAQTITNGDLDLSVFEKYGNVTIYPLTSYEETKERIADADAVLLNKTLMDKETLSLATHLKYIGIFATGFNMVDLDYCREHGITVCNAGSYSTDAVAQAVFGFLLNHYSRTSDFDRFVKDGGWMASSSFSPFVFPTAELAGKTMGIFGYGAIGKRVAIIAKAFGMKVIATPHRTLDASTDGVADFVDFDTLLSSSDVLSLHCPLNAETKELFDAAAFAKCKKGMYFVNTSRGGVIVEPALRDALESGHLSGAGIDVLTVEPMQRDCVLYGAKNVTFTPHVGWAPYETRSRLLSIVEDNLASFLNGTPKHVIV